MSDLTMMEKMLKVSHVGFNTTVIYSTEYPYPKSGFAIWLFKGGHFEFNLEGTLKKVVDY